MTSISRIDEIPRGGKCTGHNPEIWFPLADKSDPGRYSEKYRKAKSDTALAINICNTCEIKLECLSYALYHEMFGIWGGATERDRQRMRKELNIIPIPRVPVNLLFSYGTGIS